MGHFALLKFMMYLVTVLMPDETSPQQQEGTVSAKIGHIVMYK